MSYGEQTRNPYEDDFEWETRNWHDYSQSSQKHTFPCIDALVCSRCITRQKFLDDAMETVMAEKHMHWCVTCKAHGEKTLAVDTVSRQPLCASCLTEQTVMCASDCDTRILQADGVRIGQDIHCQRCAQLNPNVASCVMEAITRDTFNERRR